MWRCSDVAKHHETRGSNGQWHRATAYHTHTPEDSPQASSSAVHMRLPPSIDSVPTPLTSSFRTPSLTSACLCPWWVTHHGEGGKEAVFSGQGLAVQGQAHLHLPDAQVGSATATATVLLSPAASRAWAQSSCISSLYRGSFSCLLLCGACVCSRGDGHRLGRACCGCFIGLQPVCIRVLTPRAMVFMMFALLPEVHSCLSLRLSQRGHYCVPGVHVECGRACAGEEGVGSHPGPV